MTVPVNLYYLTTALLCSAFLVFVGCATSNTPAQVTQKAGPVVVRHDGTQKTKPDSTRPDTEKGTIERTREGLPGAASSPLHDLNLRTPVPPDFLENLGYVYTMKPRLTCEQIAYQIADLDEALIEMDTDILAAEQIAHKNDSASETTLDVIGGIASSIIPLRPVVRTITGARKAKKHYDERFDNGRRRRAFLKGYGLAKGCKPPSAPLVTYAPNWGQEKQVDPNAPNKRWKDSQVPPAGR